MAILFATFVALGLILGWIKQWSLALVWSCVVASLVFGLLAELLVARWRFHSTGSHAWRVALRHIAVNWLLAFGAGAIALALLRSAVFDSVKTLQTLALVIFLEFVAVCSVAAIISARRQDRSPTRVPFLQDFGDYALLNIVSMIVGVLAGRLYLNVFYPGVG